MELFLKILLAHLLGDFVLQPDSWVKEKSKRKLRSVKLYLHMGVHAVLLAVMLGFNVEYWAGATVIIVSHFFIDAFKNWSNTKRTNAQRSFIIDQTAHILIIAGVVYAYNPFPLSLESIVSYNNLLLIVSLVLVTFVAAIIIKVFMANWNPEKGENQEESLARAGRFIGILERLLVFLFITIGRWEAIGFLLAAKSIFRFGDLKESKDRQLTEYILIGTLLSFGIAILVGLAYVKLFEYY